MLASIHVEQHVDLLLFGSHDVGKGARRTGMIDDSCETALRKRGTSRAIRRQFGPTKG